MSVGPYQTTKTLGSGAFGVVKLATKKGSDREFAIKCISKRNIVRNRMGEQVMKEISIMKKLKHEYIVHIEDILMSEEFVYISMEYASGGELWDKVTLGGKLAEKACKRYTWQMCTALAYCHSHNVCHRDIKPQNILLDKNDNVKLADFGFASVMEVEELKKGHGTSGGFMGNERLITIEEERASSGDVDEFEMSMEITSKKMKTMSTFCGTVSYMAPEIERQDKYLGDKADVWSLGIVVYVLLNGFMPFKENDTRKDKYNTRRMSKDSKDFLSNMLEVSPIKRWTMKRLLEHAWLEGEVLDVETPSQQHERSTSADSSPSSCSNEDSDECETANDKEVFEFNVGYGFDSMERVISMLQHHSWNVKVVDGSNIKISKMEGKMIMVGVKWLQQKKQVHVKICNINRLECRPPMIRLKTLFENIEQM